MKPKPNYLSRGSSSARKEREDHEITRGKLRKTEEILSHTTLVIIPKLNQLQDRIRTVKDACNNQVESEIEKSKRMDDLQEQITSLSKAHQQMFAEHREHITLRMDKMEARQDEQQKNILSEMKQLQNSLEENHAETELMRSEFESFQVAILARVQQNQRIIHEQRDASIKDVESMTSSLQGSDSRIAALDTKLFDLEKNVLRLKLSLDPALGAEACNSTGPATRGTERSSKCHAAESARRMKELQSDMEMLKDQAASVRSADRHQFNAMTNRLREVSRRVEAAASESQSVRNEFRDETNKLLLRLSREFEDKLRTLEQRTSEESKLLRRQLEESFASSSHEKGVAAYQSLWEDLEKTKDYMNQVKNMVWMSQQSSEDNAARIKIIEGLVHGKINALSNNVTRVDNDMLALYEALVTRVQLLFDRIPSS